MSINNKELLQEAVKYYYGADATVDELLPIVKKMAKTIFGKQEIPYNDEFVELWEVMQNQSKRIR